MAIIDITDEAVARSEEPGASGRMVERLGRPFEGLVKQLSFDLAALKSMPRALHYKKVIAVAQKAVPEMAFVVHRGRGWAKIVSDTGSMQLGLTGIEIAAEPKFKQLLHLVSGNLDDLRQPGTILIFDNQAEKLGVKLGDALTISAPTTRGTNNTIDVRIAAIAHSLGLLSTWNCDTWSGVACRANPRSKSLSSPVSLDSGLPECSLPCAPVCLAPLWA